jgi:ABC-type Fe3+ transport system permease subunit
LTDNKKIRRHGAVAFVFFSALFGIALWREKEASAVFFGLLSVVGAGLLIAPGPLRPVYTAWVKIAHAIGVAVTAIMLSICYFLVMTPFAFFMRKAVGRTIAKRPDRACATYWVSRTEPIQAKDRFHKRY